MMAISFSCPQCHRAYRVANDQLAGRKVQCKHCAALISIPHPAEPVEERLDPRPTARPTAPPTAPVPQGLFDDEDDEDEAAYPAAPLPRTSAKFKKRKKSRSGAVWVIGGLLAGAVGMVAVVGLVIWGAVAVVQGIASGSALKPYTSQEGGFSVLLPGRPQKETQTLSTVVGPIDMVMFSCESGNNNGYAVLYSDLPPKSMRSPSLMLQDSAHGVVSSSSGRVVSEQSIVLGHYPGREVTFERRGPGPDMGRVRLYLVDRRLYQVMVLGSDSWISSPNAEKFFASFALLSELKAAPVAGPAGPAGAPTAPVASGTTPGAFTSDAGGFSMAMPGQPTEQVQSVPTPAGPIELHTFSVEESDHGYMASYCDYPPAILSAPADQVLDGAADGAVRTSNGRKLSRQTLSLNGHPGREILIERSGAGPARVRMRLYLVGRRLYQIGVLGPELFVSSQAADQSLASFTLRDASVASSSPAVSPPSPDPSSSPSPAASAPGPAPAPNRRPNSNPATEALSLKSQAQNHIINREDNEAMRLLEQAAQLDPKEAATLWADAAGIWVQRNKGRALIAVKKSLDCPMVNGSDQLQYYTFKKRADVLLDVGEPALAIPQYEEALRRTQIDGYRRDCERKIAEARELLSARNGS